VCPVTEEGRIKKEICDWLSLHPHRCVFTMTPRGGMGNYTSRYLQRGWPDITGMWDSIPLFIEVKTPKGKISKEQLAFFEKAKKFKCFAIIARDLKDILEVLSDDPF
jgi:hypothetical protein